MTKQRPVPVGTPINGDEANINAAKLAEEIFTFPGCPEQLGMHRKLMQALHWSRICSAGFWKIYLNDQAGDAAEAWVGPDGEPVSDPQSQRPMTGPIPDQLVSQGVSTKRV
jgi:hypothetical protein